MPPRDRPSESNAALYYIIAGFLIPPYLKCHRLSIGLLVLATQIGVMKMPRQ